MDVTGISALILVALLLFSILFELALVAGAPLGKFTAGGKYQGVLPAKARLQRFWYIGGWLLFLGHYLAQAGVLMPLLDQSLNQVANWVAVAALGFGIYYNSRTSGKFERALWMPFSMALVICALLVALQ